MRTYNPRNIPLARHLRKNMTPWERKLWYNYLRNCPVRFQRQKAIGGYIADFYCASARLIVELDGSQHYTEAGMEYDRERSMILTRYGLQVIRFTNREVDTQFSSVCNTIHHTIEKRRGEMP